MIFIYNLAIRLYVLAIRLAALGGNKKAALWILGRKDWRKRFTEVLKPGERRVWFHCSSLGEFEQGRPVMERLKIHPDGYPDEEIKIVLTFFSPSGYEVQKNYKGADYVFYLPADTSSNAADFVSLVNPEKAFFTKYEYWHYYLHQLNEKSIPLYLISAIFRPRDRFFKWYGGFFREMLRCVTHFFVQDIRSQNLLAGIGFSNSTVAGDTRFDRVSELAGNAKAFPEAELFCKGRLVMVAGSTWHADERILAEIMKSFSGRIKLIIAPHEISESRIGEVKSLFSSFQIVRFSNAENAELNSADVLLIDNIGMLSSLYRYGSFAFVGGGFGKGIHNTLEAAVYGIPVFFGPMYQKFNEARELLDCGGAFSVSSAAGFAGQLEKFLGDDAERIRAGKAAFNYVQSNSGATERILSKLA